jgi:uncharacterized RDD family membrane protein YckC
LPRAGEGPPGLVRRAAAFGIDYLPIAAYLIVVAALSVGLSWLVPDARALASTPLRGQLLGFVTVTLPISLYFVHGEASGATWGKRHLGLRVVDRQGNALGLARSAARTALKFLPWELSHFAMWRLPFDGSDPPAAFTVLLVVVWTLVGANVISLLASPRRLTLYDRLSRTRVTWAS